MSNDLIRRSELLETLKKLEIKCECPGIDFVELRKVIAKIPAVRPGTILDGMVVENPDWHLYTEYRDGVPSRYRYGPSWQATALMVDGGYKTPEEAKLAWLREWEKHK